ncbi:protein of unassigned function [Methylobacterium oryzae CBMB20]|uniref:Protein of unassigned function n=1 Tax=Methylobacterium oryzae CBMB20 TaxID=693986 RepID=A0A089NU41_9HYPH|nr:protein of unassigned function [Methylobacterium oryzae CBMB20]
MFAAQRAPDGKPRSFYEDDQLLKGPYAPRREYKGGILIMFAVFENR